MKKIVPYWWMILTGIILGIIPISSKEINLGALVVSRQQAIESGMYYMLFAFSLLLFVGIYLSVKNHNRGNLILELWGVFYTIIFIPFAYVQFGIFNIMLIVIMLAYSGAWYYGASKIVGAKNA